MRQLLYVMGAYGQQVVQTALENAPARAFLYLPFPHHKYPNGITLGWVDRLPDNRGRGFQAIVLDWLQKAEPERTIVAGHYLANEIFLEEVRRQGYDLTVAYAGMTSSAPAGEEVRIANLAARWVEPSWWLDAEESVAIAAARLRLHPTVEGMRRPCLTCEDYRVARERAPQSRV